MYFLINYLFDVEKKFLASYKKISLFMRMSVVLSFVFLNLVYSYEIHGQNAIVSLQVKNQTVSDVLENIEKQSNYFFFYNNKEIDVNRLVSIDVVNGQLRDVLDIMFSNSKIQYSVLENSIILSNREIVMPLSEKAQGIAITGTVTDTDGVPFPGVNVVIKGANIGVITGADGQFSINIPNEDAVLVFSFVGYATQEVLVGDQRAINVTLNEDTRQLEEVVVIGYGTSKKSDLTGSLSTVSNKNIEKLPVTNIASALQGQVPGASISNLSGAPGSELKVRIRGANSILGSNDPLYVVDGVVLNVGLNELNVGDIENITILKDASATAIYGSRGANGVVLFTTKKGGNQTPQVQASVNLGINQLPKKYDLLDAASFAEITNVFRPGYFSSAEIENFRKNGGVDWQDEVFQTGITQDYKLGVSGGSPTSSYYISGNVIDQTGIVTNSKMSKYLLRSNVSTSVGKRLKIDLSLTGGRTTGLNTGDNGAKGTPVWLAPIFSPTFPIYDADGKWNRTDNLCGTNYSNPLMQLKERHGDFLNTSLTANTKLSYQIINGLKLDVLLGIDNISRQNGNISNEWITNNNPTTASLSESKSYTWQNSNILTYNTNIQGKHDITVMAANEQTSTLYSYFNASGMGVYPISVGYNNLGLADTKNASSNRTKYALQSFFGRVAYSFMGKYLLTATYRADGTSKFQGKNKWGYFPSAALAWRVTEESFMQGQTVVNNLKIRGSWGITGNQGVNPYATIARVDNYSNSYGQPSMYPGTYYVGADNPDLKWETTEQTNIGFDVSFLQGRIALSADYYVKNTSDLLLAVSIPNYNGGGSINKNVGDVQNKGFEFTLFAVPVATKDFSWDFNFNISSYKNKVVNLGEEKMIWSSTIPITGMFQDSPFVLKIGESMGSFWGYRWEGIYKSSEAAQAAQFGFQPGDNKYLNFDATDSEITSTDQHIIGCALPKFVWGFDNNFSYKNWSLNILLQAVQGRKILNTTYASASVLDSDATAITSVDGADYWTPQNENAKFGSLTTNTGKTFMASSQFLQDGSYVKVKNIGLSYDIKRSVTGFADIRLTVSAQNLLTFTKYKGYDPETSSSSNDIDGAVDVGAYPNPRTISFGLQLNF